MKDGVLLSLEHFCALRQLIPLPPKAIYPLFYPRTSQNHSLMWQSVIIDHIEMTTYYFKGKIMLKYVIKMVK